MRNAILTVFMIFFAMALVSCAALGLKDKGVDMTGTWHLEVETPMGSGTPQFTLKQEGNKLSGTYKGAFGQAPVSGTLEGNKFELQFESMGTSMIYEGVVQEDTIKGKVDFGGRAEGTFTGEKE
ncbi:MAG: hypothetical protein K9J85_09595 [Desulfobacteraceae bacterium]|nr:hypothetical protein [Desulfobacteraceae bacterium]